MDVRHKKVLLKGANMEKQTRFYVYRLFLAAFLILFLFIELGVSFYLIHRRIPSKLYFFAGKEQWIDFGMPATGEVKTVSGGNKSNISQGDVKIDLSVPFQLKYQEQEDYSMNVRLFGILPIKKVDIHVINDCELIPMGTTIGIYMHSEGVLIVGLAEFETGDGEKVSPSQSLLKSGDYVIAVNGEPVNEKEELIQRIESCEGEELSLTVRRGKERIIVSVKPKRNINGEYKAGIWVRDNFQGVGTLTFVDENGRFGALGHGIADADTGLIVEADGGSLYETKIVGLKRGVRGEPGEMTGRIVYENNKILGEVTENSMRGVYGRCKESVYENEKKNAIPICLKQDIKIGKAFILCALEDEPEAYEVEITAVHTEQDNVNRGIELRVTDERLLQITGGIVQGMSGSPIIQNGRLVGAVTHVLVNTPEKGYGIFIENMLE